MPRAVQVDPRALPDDTPMKLQVIARAAFPDGSVTAAGLRREAAAGRLETYRVAGVTMTTMAAIRRMMELCRVVYDGSADASRQLVTAQRSTVFLDEAAAAEATFRMRIARLRGSGGRRRGSPP